MDTTNRIRSKQETKPPVIEYLSLYQRKPFKILNGMQDKIEILLDVFEPADLLDDTAYYDTSNPVIPSLLPS